MRSLSEACKCKILICLQNYFDMMVFEQINCQLKVCCKKTSSQPETQIIRVASVFIYLATVQILLPHIVRVVKKHWRNDFRQTSKTSITWLRDFFTYHRLQSNSLGTRKVEQQCQTHLPKELSGLRFMSIVYLES